MLVDMILFCFWVKSTLKLDVDTDMINLFCSTMRFHDVLIVLTRITDGASTSHIEQEEWTSTAVSAVERTDHVDPTFSLT